MKRPRVTRKVVDGIIAATTNLLAGDVASAFGYDGPEERQQWDQVVRADQWAREMRGWMDSKKKA